MAVGLLGTLGTNSSKSAATTIAVTNSTGSAIPAGTVIHIAGTWDNIASVTAPTITCSAVGGGTASANHATAVGSGVTTTAGSGIWHQCFRVLTTASIANGATIATLTSNQSAVVRSIVAEGYSGCTTTLRSTVVTGTSTTGSPSALTGGSALVAGDLVIGSVSFENNAMMTGDADTLNGSWDTISGVNTTGSTAATNNGVAVQNKVVTATGGQTFNPTGGVADSVACVYALVPAVAWVGNQDDPVGVTDAIALAVTKPDDDSVGITDARTVLQDQRLTKNDAVGITDSVNASLAGGGSLTLWPDSSTVTLANDNAAAEQGINLGGVFKATVAGSITHLRYYETSLAMGTVDLHLIDSAGTVLASATHTAVDGSSGWRNVALGTPYAVTPNTWYMVHYHVPSRTTQNNMYVTVAPNLSVARSTAGGELVTAADGVVTFASLTSNGRYDYGALAVPASTFNSENYGADVVFAPAVPIDKAVDDAVGITDAATPLLASPPTEGFIAYNFDEGTGTTSANQGTGGPDLTSVPGWTTPGHSGSGAAMTAATTAGAEYTLASAQGSTWTMMGWFKPRYTGGWASFWENSVSEFFLEYNAPMAVDFYTVALGALSGGFLDPDVWVHIAVVAEAGVGTRLVMNGTTTQSSAVETPMPSGLYEVGGSAAQPMLGETDDFRIYVGSALTDAQIQATLLFPVLGGGGLTGTPADPVGITDALTLTQSQSLTQADSVGATDAVALAVDRTQADAVGVTDAAGAQQSLSRTQPDAVGVTDALALQVDRTVGDAVGVTDAAAATQSQSLTPSDAVGVTDSVSAGFALDRALDESVGATDVAATLLDATRAPADPVGISDTPQATQDMQRAPSDAVGVTDASVLARELQLGESLTITDASVLERTLQLSDAVGVSDAALLERTDVTADAVGITDAAALARELAPADAVGVTDTVAAQVSLGVSDDDPVGITDALAVSRETSLSDAVGASDTTTASLTSDRTAADPVGLTDTVAIVREVVLGDAVGVSDSVTRIASQTLALDEAVGVSDAVGATFGASPTPADAVGITDAITVVQSVSRTQSDTVGLTDAAASAQALLRTPADAVGVSDATTLARELALADGVGLTDTATPDLALGGVTHDLAPADDVAVTDSVTVVMVRYVTISDLVQIADAATSSALHEALVSDVVGITDGITFSTPTQYDNAHIVVVERPRYIVGAPPPLRFVVSLDEPVTHIVFSPTRRRYVVTIGSRERFVVSRGPGPKHVVSA